jgi:hypothetical protein
MKKMYRAIFLVRVILKFKEVEVTVVRKASRREALLLRLQKKRLDLTVFIKKMCTTLSINSILTTASVRIIHIFSAAGMTKPYRTTPSYLEK